MIARIVDTSLGTVGKRVYATILLVALTYLILHLTVGLRLVLASFEATPFVAIAVSVTIVTALANTLQVSENLVFGLVLLLRGPRPLVAPPTAEPDRQLPLLIVQIPGRNEPFNEILRSIDSVLHLGYPADRIRVQHIDNSDDQRWQEVVAAYRHDPRVEVLHRDGTGGFKAGNLNVGLKRLAAQRLGDPANIFIGMLDVGDTFARDMPRAMVSEFALNDDLAFVQAVTQVRNPQDTLITKAESFVMSGWCRWYAAMQGHYGMPSIYGHHVIVRFKALLQVEGWDETKVAEDWATSTRMLLAGWQGKWVDYAPTDPNMISGEMSPPTLEGQQKQRGKWATGGSELMRDYLAGWLRAPLPWNYRLDLLIRLTSHPTAALRFLGRLMLPMWIAFAAINREETTALHFGLLSASMQSAWLIYRGITCVSYVREGNFKTAFGIIAFAPIQMAFTMPIMPHIIYGVYRGLRYTHNTFVVSPKKIEHHTSMRRLIVTQRMALMMAVLFALPATLTTDVPSYVHYAALSLLISSALTVIGILLVPVTQMLRGLLSNFRSKK